MQIPRIYVAGPYSAPEYEDRYNNVSKAVTVGRLIVQMGAFPVVPHMAGLEFESLQSDWHWWMAVTSRELGTCDACAVLPDHKHSKGTLKEIEQCRSTNIPLFFLPTDVNELHAFVVDYINAPLLVPRTHK